jgi:hypothetical protein
MHAWLVDMLLLLSMVNFSTTAEYIFVLGPKKNSCSKRLGDTYVVELASLSGYAISHVTSYSVQYSSIF